MLACCLQCLLPACAVDAEEHTEHTYCIGYPPARLPCAALLGRDNAMRLILNKPLPFGIGVIEGVKLLCAGYPPPITPNG